MTHSIRLATLFLIIYLLPNCIVSQKLVPNIDQVLHLSEVSEMAVSQDKKYFALADADGIVTFRDVETGKVIATEDYDGMIEDIAFSDKEGCLIVVFTYGLGDDSETYIEHFDFINNEQLSSVHFANLEVYGVDFSNQSKHVLLSRLEGKPVLANYETGEITYIEVPGDYSSASFNAKDNCVIYNGTHEEIDIDIYEYNIATKKADFIQSIPYVEGDNDLNNKLSYYEGDQLVFIDHMLDVSLSINNAGFMNGETSIIHDFAFSPDKKYITLVGGNGDIQTMSQVGYDINESTSGTGIVALFDVATGNKIWQTSSKENQPEFDLKDVDWIDNESFMVGDKNGNVFTMSIGDEYYYNAFLLPRKVFTFSDVETDLSSVVYSQKDSPTYKFDIKDGGQRETLYDHFSNRISMVNDGIVAATGPTISTGATINTDVYGLHLTKTYPYTIYNDIIDMSIAEAGNYYAVSTDMLYASLFSMGYVGINNMDKDENGAIKRVYLDDATVIPGSMDYLQRLNNSLREKPDSFSVELEPATTIFRLDNQEKPIIINGLTGKLQFSKNGRYLSIAASHTILDVRIFDTEKKSWFSLPGTSETLLYNYFSQDHPYALSVNNNSETIIWNTNTLEILFRGKLQSKYFEPNTPIAETNSQLQAQLELFTENVSFMPDGKGLFIQLQGSLHLLDIETGMLENIGGGADFINSKLSPDGKYMYTEEYDSENFRARSIITRVSDFTEIYEKPFLECFDAESQQRLTGQAFFHPDKPLVLIHNAHSSYELFDMDAEELVATLKFFENGEWIVFTPDGLFDGSKLGRNAIYYTYGTKVILFDQIKEKYWEPDLLSKLITNPDLIITDRLDKEISLYPEAQVSLGNKKGEVLVQLKGSQDQVGAVSLYINDKEVETDINPNRTKELTVNVFDDKYRSYMFQEGLNEVSFVTYNKEGWINSRPSSIYLSTNLAKDKGTGGENQVVATSRKRRGSRSANKPGLFGLFIGTSKYQNEKLNLSFADKDAKDLCVAFDKISMELYDRDRVRLKTLVSNTDDPDSLSSKANILKAFGEIEQQAGPNDIIVLFLSGHGLTIDNDFYYLTIPAGKSDLRTNVEHRNTTCLASSEIKEALRKIKSNKQIMILDACHSGQITKIFEANDKATSTTLNKALENLEDKMGVYVLASSESNQKSFETETLQQGLLTFALRYGMSGEASQDDDILDVAELLTFASINAEQIGKQILGKPQRPVLGITQGGNPFPVGTKNPELKVELPQKKVKFAVPRFIVMTTLSDPKNIEKAIKDQLSVRGAIGTNEDFIYSKNEVDPDAIKIAGSYSVKNGNIELNWNLLKQEEIWKGPISANVSESDMSIIGNVIINESLKHMN